MPTGNKYNTDKMYNEYYNMIKGSLVKIFGEEQTRDAFQHAYGKLINMSEEEQKEIKSVYAWLKIVMKHHLIDEKKADNTRKQREEKGIRVWLQKYSSPENNLDDLTKQVLRNIVNDVIPELPKRMQQVMVAVMTDCTDEEIATMLDIEESTVRGHKRKAIRILRDKLL